MPKFCAEVGQFYLGLNIFHKLTTKKIDVVAMPYECSKFLLGQLTILDVQKNKTSNNKPTLKSHCLFYYQLRSENFIQIIITTAVIQAFALDRERRNHAKLQQTGLEFAYLEIYQRTLAT